MSDWAEDEARKICGRFHWDEDCHSLYGDKDDLLDDIATAFRSIEKRVREEDIEIIKSHRKFICKCSKYDDPPEDCPRVKHIIEAIRASGEGK